ncbi:gastric triacylglycerol lipase-like [Amphiura filiformis]|uniref:gastric triacylglycerol lipase-like n=1 Tax=Amphiura filiformis TaxID=82378 RepID=UPI003B21A7E6
MIMAVQYILSILILSIAYTNCTLFRPYKPDQNLRTSADFTWRDTWVEFVNSSLKFHQKLGKLCDSPRGKLTYEPDTKYNASGLISSKGYPVQEFEVPTKDGFLLGMQRIPHGKHDGDTTEPRPAVLLQHGLLGTSTHWVNNLANESLAFILADAGYDVWLGNVRGNTYSKKHQSLKPSQREFWYWSWDEMGKYDLPGMVDFILNTTGHKQISYIGHSQGTTMAFAGLSISKDLQSKINLFVGLGPVANTTYMPSPVRQIAYPDVYIPIVETLDLLHLYDFMPNFPIMADIFANTVCDNDITVTLCEDIFYLMAGYSCQHMNASRIPVYTADGLGGTSIWTVEHWGQMTYAKNFAMFDYGPHGNLAHYGQIKPPVYNVSEIDTPVALFYGSVDILADPEDVQILIPQLKNLVYQHEIDTYGHLDFIWAFDAVDYVYKDILKLLKGAANE